MSRRALIGVALASLIAGIGFQGGRLVQSADSAESQLKQLLRERHELRKQVVELLQKTDVSRVELMNSMRDAMSAELDTCETKAQRLAVLQKIAAHEKQATKLFEQTPGTSKIERLYAQIRGVDAQIDLEREKLKN